MGVDAFSHPAPQLPLIGFVLFDAEGPDMAAIAARLGEEFGGGVEADGEVLSLELEGGATAVVAPVGHPVPGDEAVRSAHPVWWTDPTPVVEHRSHCVVTIVRGEDRQLDRPEAVTDALLFAAVASVVAEAPDAVALYSGNAGITLPAEAYARIVSASLDAGTIPVELWTSVWLFQGEEEGAVDAYTAGLDTFGHANLMVRGSVRAPSEVYQLLASVCAYLVASGQQINPGETLEIAEDALVPVSAGESTFHGEQVLALGL